jgi:predicted dehydrogenase
MTSLNKQFLQYLNTDTVNNKINEYLVNPISLTVARKWLKNIRKSLSRQSSSVNRQTDINQDAEIIKNDQHYGLPTRPTQILRIFVVGCGARSTGYLQALFEDYAHSTAPYILVGVADPIPSARQRLIKMVRDCGYTNDILEYNLWQNVDDKIDGNTVDVVIIGTMDQDHADPAIEFMNRKCHVIVEKPLDIDANKMLAMVEATKRNNVIASVCTVLEYTSHAMRMKQLIKKMNVPLTSLLIREQVGWHHDAYAYGTGPFSNSDTTSPYTVAKTIHDASMAINLMETGVKSVIYMPSNTPRATGQTLEIYDPVSYLTGYIHKILRELLASFPDIYQKIEKEILNPDLNLDSDQIIEQIADLYRPFHLYLYNHTNFWYNPQLRNHSHADQPNGYTMVMNMENCSQFTLLCQPYSTKVCVRYYEARSPSGELISNTPDIRGYLFGEGGNDIAFTEEECSIPDERKISHRNMHEGADAKFIHTVMRKLALVDKNDDVRKHPLNTHFERNAKLTAGMLDATEHPYELRFM